MWHYPSTAQWVLCPSMPARPMRLRDIAVSMMPPSSSLRIQHDSVRAPHRHWSPHHRIILPGVPICLAHAVFILERMGDGTDTVEHDNDRG